VRWRSCEKRGKPTSEPVSRHSPRVTMTKISSLLVSLAVFCGGSSALAPSKVPRQAASSSLTATKPAFDVKRVAFNGLAAASLASALVVGPMADAIDMFTETPPPSFFGSSSLIAERVTREGLYKEYDVDLGDQVYDDARSTYKSAKETKTKKGMKDNILCVVGRLSCLWLLNFHIIYSPTPCFAFIVSTFFIINNKENILP
jgi:hypothetical protein